MAEAVSDREARLERAEAARGVAEALDDAALGRLLRDGRDGWGRACRATVSGHRVFVKAVPVTDVEHRVGLSTANLYEIPSYLNYPFGSPGLGAGRELAFAQTSTTWVETGACTGFPILLHHRLVDRRDTSDGLASPVGYSCYRDDNPAMNRYLADRAAASVDLVLVYEDIPHAAVDWLIEHPGDVTWILDDVRATVRFLRDHDVVHFDVDLFNIVTDGQHAFVTDHGLVLDGSFELTDTERCFLADNRHFDDGNLIMSVGHQLYWTYRALSDTDRHTIDDRLGIHGAPFDTAFVRLLETLDATTVAPFVVDPTLRSVIGEHRSVIEYMHDFSARARASWDRHTRLDDARLAHLLARASDAPPCDEERSAPAP